jgi:hypothetical protein
VPLAGEDSVVDLPAVGDPRIEYVSPLAQPGPGNGLPS